MYNDKISFKGGCSDFFHDVFNNNLRMPFTRVPVPQRTLQDTRNKKTKTKTKQNKQTKKHP